MTRHTCHAIGCENLVQPRKLMCLQHWRMVPPDIQELVMKSYRSGQCDDKRPSLEWLKAARAAINHVRHLEHPTGGIR
jgi:hypothetical protein